MLGEVVREMSCGGGLFPRGTDEKSLQVHALCVSAVGLLWGTMERHHCNPLQRILGAVLRLLMGCGVYSQTRWSIRRGPGNPRGQLFPCDEKTGAVIPVLWTGGAAAHLWNRLGWGWADVRQL